MSIPETSLLLNMLSVEREFHSDKVPLTGMPLSLELLTRSLLLMVATTLEAVETHLPVMALPVQDQVQDLVPATALTTITVLTITTTEQIRVLTPHFLQDLTTVLITTTVPIITIALVQVQALLFLADLTTAPTITMVLIITIMALFQAETPHFLLDLTTTTELITTTTALDQTPDQMLAQVQVQAQAQSPTTTEPTTTITTMELFQAQPPHQALDITTMVPTITTTTTTPSPLITALAVMTEMLDQETPTLVDLETRTHSLLSKICSRISLTHSTLSRPECKTLLTSNLNYPTCRMSKTH